MAAPIRGYVRRLDVPKLYPLSLRRLDYLIADDEIPVIRLGRSVLFKASDIEALLDKNRHIGSSPPKGRGRPKKKAQKTLAINHPNED